MSTARIAIVLPLAIAGLIAGCDTTAPDAAATPAPASASAPAPTAQSGRTLTSTAKSADGEVAQYEIVGDTVYVHNHLCAVSHSPLADDKLDKFVSTVTYQGDDPRFKGKQMVFNQCCNMCIKRFPAMWAEDPNSILAFHGLQQG
ncbi:MAG: hypothetical protein GXP62_15285 [Oligoflexia bacterium]|nr:hypothetical protein [Oligoflexia bacterium]